MSFASEYSELRKKRKKSSEELAQDAIQKNMKYSSLDIAPVLGGTPIVKSSSSNTGTTTKADDENKSPWFKNGKGNVLQNTLGTVGDVGVNVAEGFLSSFEGIADLLLYGAGEVAGIFSEDAEKFLDLVGDVNTTQEMLGGVESYVDQYSYLGENLDSAAGMLGQIGAMALTSGVGKAAGLGKTGLDVLNKAHLGASAMGSGISNARNDGATDGEAWDYGALAAANEIISEMLFGGLGKAINAVGFSKGIGGIDDMIAKSLSSKISNQIVKNAVQLGVKATGEGLEEVVSYYGDAAAKKLTYMSDKDFSELVNSEEARDAFVVGLIGSGVSQSGIVPGMKKGSYIESTRAGRDFVTGLTANEQKVVDKEVENRIKEAKENGEKVDKKAEAKIREAVEEDLKSGGISIETIEEVLGGDSDSYKAYKDAIDSDNATIEELKELYGEKAVDAEFASRVAEAEQNGQKLTSKQKESLRAEIAAEKQQQFKAEVEGILGNSKRGELRDALNADMKKMLTRTKGKTTQTDSYLLESYAEVARRGQKFNADVNQYKNENARKTIQNILDSGVANNTNRMHQLANTLAKISEDKGIIFSATDAKRLSETSFGVNGKTVNGFVTKDGITINMDSPKYLNSVVGHEISHVLEKNADLYKLLQDAAFEFAKGRKSSNGKFENEYMERLFNARQLYKDVDGYKGTQGHEAIKKEVVSDLVGDYLFTDSKFIENLSAKHRNLFQKIFDEIKYLCKIATAGSAEKRQLEKVKKAFEDAYRSTTTSVKADTKTDAKSDAKGDTKTETKTGLEAKTAEYDTVKSEYDKVYQQFIEANRAGNAAEVARLSEKMTELIKRMSELEADGVEAKYSLSAEQQKTDKTYLDAVNRGDTETAQKMVDEAAEKWSEGNEIYITDPETGEAQFKFYRSADGGRTVWNGHGNNKNQGVFLTSDPYIADAFDVSLGIPKGQKGGQHITVYAKAENPFVIDAQGKGYTNIPIDEKSVPNWLYEESASGVEWSDEANDYVVVDYIDIDNLFPVAFKQGYDAVIVTNIKEGVGGGLAADIVLKDGGKQMKSADPVTYDDNGNVIPISQRFNAENNDIRYSLSADTNGRQLSEGQQNYFKNSKIVDENGNLKVMYHGSPESFTVFDKKKSRSSGTYGNGFYFTDSISHAATYGNAYEVYLNITHPLQNGTNEITKDQVRKFVEAIAEDEDYGIDNYGYDATIDSVTDSVYGKSDFAMIMDLNISCIGNMVEAIELFNKINGTDYNGIVAPTETVAFYPEQIKRVDNQNPTSDPDTRYSLSDSDGKKLTKEQGEYFKDSKMRDENGNLKVMYHGSRNAGFHVFDPAHSDDGTSLFFVDRNDVAASYSGTSETYEAQSIRTAEDMNNFLAKIGYDYYEAVEKDGKFELLENGEHVAWSDTAKGIYEEFCWYEGVGDGDVNYKVYLNLTNPLVVDVEGRNWNNISREFSQELYDRYQTLTNAEKDALVNLASWEEISIFRDEIRQALADTETGVSGTYDKEFAWNVRRAYEKLGGNKVNMYDLFTIASDNFSDESVKEFAVKQMNTRDYAQKAKAEGYDGVIFNNIVDIGGYGGDYTPSTVAIAFDSNQVKSVANEKPTGDPDIRYSLSAEGERQKRYGDFFVRSEDVRYVPMEEDIAPVKEDIAPAQNVAVNAPETVDEEEMFPDDVSLQQLLDEVEALVPQIEAAYKANDREGGMPLYERYQALTAEIKRREAEDAAWQDESLSTLTDEDVPPEVEAPYYGEGETLTADDPFANRDMKAVSRDRKTKAYMYENPEVKPFFQSEAAALLGELERTEKPQTFYNGWMKYEMSFEAAQDIPEIYRTKRVTTPDIAYLRDTVKMSYADIEKGLKAIIEDNGAENIAAAKKIEFVLNDRLLNGYEEDGYHVPPNQDYINLINEKQISEYSDEARKQFFEVADEFAPVAEAPAAAEETVIDAPMAEAYEAIKPKREQTSEPRMKRVDSKDGKQRKWVGTSTESDAVDGKILPDDLDQSKIHYQPISNKKTLNDANTKLNGMGYDAAVAYFNSQFSNKKTTVEDIVLGERLIQEAIKRGDTKTAGELIEDVAILGTELGQKVQALSIIKRLTPEGQLRMLKRTVERGKTKCDKAFEGVEITQEMIDHILKTYGKDGTYDQAKLNKAVEDVKQQIADQMKVTKLEKVNAWRYLSMLGNPKTHIRNLVSNVAMRGTMAVKNAVARTIESIAPVKNRTKTWQRATDDVKAFAQQTTEEMKDILMDGGKYNEETSIKEKRQIFENKVLNGYYEFNSDLLSKEDWWFSKPAFNNALSEFLTANGIRTAEDIKNNPEIVEKAKKYATEQALIATFRQYSWLANKINEIERKNTATNIAVGAVLPFKKTPINIAKTGLSYSPLGFMKTLTYDISQVKKGNMEASTLVDHLSQNITGTALALIGYMLANAGFLNGGGDDDKEGDYDYQLGKQAYSINVGGATYSLSWLSPVAMPLFVGANAYEQLVEGKEWNGDVVVETLAQTLDPLSEMSFLSSLDSVLSSYDSGVEKFAGIAESAAQNYITQFAPTLLSQVATVTDDTKRSTKVAADSDFKFVDETINKLKYKIPGLRQTLEPTTDIWGNEVKQSEGMLTRAFETFLAPYSKREDISSAIDEEIKDLYSETGDTGVVPSIPYNYVNYDGVKYEMSAQDFTAFKQTYGQTAYEMLDALFATETYKNADSDTRADMVNDVYDYARDLAKQEYLAKYGVDFYNSTEDGEGVFKENPIRGAIEADLPVDEYSFSVEYPEKYKFFNDNGISYSTYKAADEDGKRAYSWAYENPGKYTMSKAISDDFLTYYQYKSDLNDLEADKDGNGKSISGSKKKKVISYINDMDLDYGQKIILFRSMYDSADDRAAYNADIVEYLNSRNDISYDEMVTILKELGFTVHSNGRVTW
jgi:hypothetical protein